MLDKILRSCTNFKQFIFDGSHSIYELLLKVFEKQGEIIDSINNLSGTVSNNYSTLDSKKEDSINITANRKLSPLGNFTGTIQGLPSFTVNDNMNKIGYLTSQFTDGQTGFVIDGGFFTGTGISKNYNGGIF